MPHFDGKGLGGKAFKEAEVPTTFLLTSFYWDNLIHFGMGPKKGEDGTYAITFPQGKDTLLPGMQGNKMLVDKIGRLQAYRYRYIGRLM